MGDLVVSSADGSLDTATRGRALVGLTAALTRSARTAGARAVGGGRWLVDVLVDVAPRIPIRDRAALLGHHPGRSDEEIAQELVRGASLASAAIGGAAGAAAAVEFMAPPLLLGAPAQLAAETLAISAVEVKLVAELHELYGERPPGGTAQRATAYLLSWARGRAVDPLVAGTGVTTVLGHAAKRELRARLLRRLGRSTTSLAPFLAGAVAGAEINRRATRALGEKLAAELRGRQRGAS